MALCVRSASALLAGCVQLGNTRSLDSKGACQDTRVTISSVQHLRVISLTSGFARGDRKCTSVKLNAGDLISFPGTPSHMSSRVHSRKRIISQAVEGEKGSGEEDDDRPKRWSEEPRASRKGAAIVDLPLEYIIRPLGRTRSNDSHKVKELMKSISEIGLQVPIDVLEVDGQYYGFSGCHRFEAHQRLGLSTITCKVRKANRATLRMHML
eukprot:jgi/Mesen1/10056/ME000730S09351